MPPIAAAGDPRAPAFEAALDGVMRDLAHQVVRDGEGATQVRRDPGDRRRLGDGGARGSGSPSPTRRWSRPRSPARTRTGAASSWRSARPARRPTATGCRSASATSSSPSTAGWRRATREAAGAAYMKRAELVIGVDLGIGARRGDGLDLRPDPPLHRDQRGLPLLKLRAGARAVALIDRDGRVLIAQRPEGKAMAGLWEFPGGKVEPGETPEAALIRELARGARHRHLGELPGAAQLRQPRLPGLPPADAALRLPQVGGRAAPARARGAEMGRRRASCRPTRCRPRTGRCLPVLRDWL